MHRDQNHLLYGEYVQNIRAEPFSLLPPYCLHPKSARYTGSCEWLNKYLLNEDEIIVSKR